MRRAAAVLAAAALTVAGCSSSSGGGQKSAAAKVSATPQSVAPKGTPIAPATVAATVRKGLADVRSLHISLDLDLDGERSTVAGDETLSAGKTQNLRVSTDDLSGSGPLQLVVVDGKTYGKLPKALNSTGKPWVLITKSSKNAKLAQLASSLDFALGSVSLDRAVALLGAATSAGVVGKTTVGGVPVTRYSIAVSVAKLPADFPGKTIIQTVGLTSIPADVYLDPAGRPVQLSQAVKVSGHGVGVKIAVSRYNQPVTITAPPADQVGTG